jgi:glycosyltransferase involved in cell wall biosynthesis
MDNIARKKVMRKILCLIDTLGMGGAERQMIGLVLLLKKHGYLADLVTYNDHDFYSELVTRYGIGTLRLYSGKTSFSKLLAVRRHIKKSGGYDCIITYKGGPNAIGCLLKVFGTRTKLIVSERIATQKMDRRTYACFKLYQFADYIVPNSFSQQKFTERCFPKLSSKTVTITNFTDTNYFHPIESCQHDSIIILTTARIARQKNVLRYLDAIDLLRKKAPELKFHFEWYGDVQSGEEEYGRAVYNKLIERDLNEIISFYPATPQIVEKYQACDIFCLPSNFEGFPNVVCEAMSCGKPVLCSRVCDNPYIVKEKESGLLFDPTNINDMAEKILEMAQMPKNSLLSLGRRGREIAESLFSQEAFVKKYIELIEK